MSNGHGEEGWIDTLREWMPSIVAFTGLVVSWIALAVAWIFKDRKRVLKQVDELRDDVDGVLWLLGQLEETHDYPEQLTTKRLQNVLRKAGNVRRKIAATQTILNRGVPKPDKPVEEPQDE